MSTLATNEQFTDAFRGLDPQRQSEIFVALTEIMANSNPKLMEMIADQIEAERGEDWWDRLTTEKQQRLEQSIQEGEEGKTVSHEQVQREAKMRTANYISVLRTTAGQDLDIGYPGQSVENK